MQTVSQLLAELSNAFSKANETAKSSVAEAISTAQNDLATVYNKIAPAKEAAFDAETAVLDHLAAFVKNAKAEIANIQIPHVQPVAPVPTAEALAPTIVEPEHDAINKTVTTDTGTTITSNAEQVSAMSNTGGVISHDQLNPPPSPAPEVVEEPVEELPEKDETVAKEATNPAPLPVAENTDLTKEPFTPESTVVHGNMGNEA